MDEGFDILNDKVLNPDININIPCNKCDGDCCTAIPMKTTFVEEMFNKYNMGVIHGQFKDQQHIKELELGEFRYYHAFNNPDVCIFKDGSLCAIYEDRQDYCRSFGTTDLMRCPYEGLEEQPKDENVKRSLKHQCMISTSAKMEELAYKYEQLNKES